MTDARKTDAGDDLLVRAWNMLLILAVTPPSEWRSKPEIHQEIQWMRTCRQPAAPLPQGDAEPVQDTYLVGGPDLRAMSGSTESDRIIQLHFRRKATDEDRKWLLEAINAKIAADQEAAAPARCDAPVADSKAPWRCSNCGERLHAAPPSRSDAEISGLPKPETMLTYASILEKPQYWIDPKTGQKYLLATGEIVEAACAALRYCARLPEKDTDQSTWGNHGRKSYL